MEHTKKERTPCRRAWAAAGAIAGIGLCLTVLWSSRFLLHTQVGSAAGTVQVQPAETFSENVSSRLGELLGGVLPPAKRSYKLSDGNLVAPMPNAEGFATAESPEDMVSVWEKAAELLEGDDTFLTPDTQLREGSTIGYYLDDTILAMTWKQVVNNIVYTFAEVKIADASQIRRFTADGKYNSGVLYTTTEMAQTVHAVLASSGDYYAYRPMGIVVNDGQVYRSRGELLDTCYVDEEGDLLFSFAGKLTGDEAVEKFVKENHIRFSLSFGPVMLYEGQMRVPPEYQAGEINRPYPRAALCQLGKRHYLIVVSNPEKPYYRNQIVWEFGRNLQSMGIETAYALDGGQTASIAFNGELVNTVSYGSQRDISDILYFATAIPDKEGGK